MTEKNIKILYIEDNPANTQLMRSVLKRLKYFELSDATDAESGLKMMEDIKPEVILMDIDLPGMNGLEALHEIRSRFAFAQSTPIIAVSANAMKSDIEQAMSAGFTEYVTKPIDIPKFIETLKNVVECLQKA